MLQNRRNWLLQRREVLYAFTKRVSGANRARELRGGASGPYLYGVDPATRYVSLPADLPPSPAHNGEPTGHDGLLES